MKELEPMSVTYKLADGVYLFLSDFEVAHLKTTLNKCDVMFSKHDGTLELVPRLTRFRWYLEDDGQYRIQQPNGSVLFFTINGLKLSTDGWREIPALKVA